MKMLNTLCWIMFQHHLNFLIKNQDSFRSGDTFSAVLSDMNFLREAQFTSAMLIWMEAWSLAPMILLLAELENSTFQCPAVGQQVSIIQASHSSHMLASFDKERLTSFTNQVL